MTMLIKLIEDTTGVSFAYLNLSASSSLGWMSGAIGVTQLTQPEMPVGPFPANGEDWVNTVGAGVVALRVHPGLRRKLALLGAVALGCCSVSGDILFPVRPFNNFVDQSFMIFQNAKPLPR